MPSFGSMCLAGTWVVVVGVYVLARGHIPLFTHRSHKGTSGSLLHYTVLSLETRPPADSGIKLMPANPRDTPDSILFGSTGVTGTCNRAWISTGVQPHQHRQHSSSAYSSSACKAQLCHKSHDPMCLTFTSCPSSEDRILRRSWGSPVLTTLKKPPQANPSFFPLTFDLSVTLFVSSHLYTWKGTKHHHTVVTLGSFFPYPKAIGDFLEKLGLVLILWLCGWYFEMKFEINFAISLYHCHRRLALQKGSLRKERPGVCVSIAS